MNFSRDKYFITGGAGGSRRAGNAQLCGPGGTERGPTDIWQQINTHRQPSSFMHYRYHSPHITLGKNILASSCLVLITSVERRGYSSLFAFFLSFFLYLFLSSFRAFLSFSSSTSLSFFLGVQSHGGEEAVWSSGL
jgi:hypothetical protein